MRRTEVLQEVWKMRFEEAYQGWQQGRLSQCEAASLLGVHERTFRRYGMRYKDGGLEGLIDYRLEQVSHRKAPVDEVMKVTERYRERHSGWSAKHYFAWYRREGGDRSYTWIKSCLQGGWAGEAGQEARRASQAARSLATIGADGAPGRQYARVVAGQRFDLIVTIDDATNEHDAMQFVE